MRNWFVYGLFLVGNDAVYKCYVKLIYIYFFLESRITLNPEGIRILWIQILINYTEGENKRKAQIRRAMLRMFQSIIALKETSVIQPVDGALP